jgi:hypothetical protein
LNGNPSRVAGIICQALSFGLPGDAGGLPGGAGFALGRGDFQLRPEHFWRMSGLELELVGGFCGFW